jgi:signal peptidase I
MDTRNINNQGADYSSGTIGFGKKTLYFIWDLIKVVAISLAIIVPIRYFLIQPFYVKGASMEPSFYDHEYLIIDEISYRFSQPQRGDIIVFKYPKDPSQFFIKRVVGLPGETVEVRDGYVFIYSDSGKKLLLNEYTYLSGEVKTVGEKTWTLQKNEFYVLGDNRDHSLDSRIFGPVTQNLIVGKVWLRGWPIDRVKVFKDINYENSTP